MKGMLDVSIQCVFVHRYLHNANNVGNVWQNILVLNVISLVSYLVLFI